MNKKEWYLNEREYISSMTSRIDTSKAEHWEELIGKDILQFLISQNRNVIPYLSNTLYMKKQENIPKSIMGTKSSNDEVLIKMFIKKNCTEPFIDFYYEYFQKGMLLLEKKDCNYGKREESVKQSLLEMILARIRQVCIRVLIYEMNICQNQKELLGNTPKEKYFYFKDKYISSNQYQHRIKNAYPIMHRCASEKVEDTVNFWVEILRQFDEEKKEIEKNIFNCKKIGNIVDIQGDFSDTHRRGKCVLEVSLDDGEKVIYKPHSLDNEQFFYSLINLIGKEIGIKMYCPHSITSATHGWTGYIKHQKCKENKEVKKYYQRLGVLIFVTYMLGTNDIHFENLIAHGEYPVIVDLENIVDGRELNVQKGMIEAVNSHIRQSVLFSGILPNSKDVRMESNVNVAGLGYSAEQKFPFKVVQIVDANTSDMRVEYINPLLTHTNNLVSLDNRCVNPGGFMKEICEGFQKAYRFVMYRKDQMKKEVFKMKNLTSRYLLADTQRYSMLLTSSYHPSLLRDGADREMLLYSLWQGRRFDDPIMNHIVNSEIRDILRGDIPIFYFNLNDDKLFDSNGEEIDQFLKSIPLQDVSEKIEQLDEEDLMQQRELICISLSFYNYNKKDYMNGLSSEYNEFIQRQKNNISVEMKNERLLLAVEKITENLLEHAICKDGKMGWYKVLVSSKAKMAWRVEPMDYYIYGGIAGIALYFHKVTKVLKIEKYYKVCRILDQELFDYTNCVTKMKCLPFSNNTGILNGESSLVFTYLQLYKLERKSYYLEYAVKHCAVMNKLIELDTNNDFLNGNAGAIIALCELYQIVEKKWIVSLAERAANKILSNSSEDNSGLSWTLNGERQPLLGMAHGNAGIAIAFEKLYRITKNKKYYEKLIKIIKYEHERFNYKISNWYDYRVDINAKGFYETDTIAWCHGAVGILLSRLIIAKAEHVGKMKCIIHKDIDRAISKLKKTYMREGMCLCHGSCGNLLILEEYLKRYENEEIQNNVEKGLEYILEKVLNKQRLLPQEINNPSLFDGYTGIGYYLLMHLEDK